MGAVPGLRATIQMLPSDVEAHFDDSKDVDHAIFWALIGNYQPIR
jgi:hypothetical protein